MIFAKYEIVTADYYGCFFLQFSFILNLLSIIELTDTSKCGDTHLAKKRKLPEASNEALQVVDNSFIFINQQKISFVISIQKKKMMQMQMQIKALGAYGQGDFGMVVVLLEGDLISSYAAYYLSSLNICSSRYISLGQEINNLIS
jgi:hypothetical protein